MTIYFFGFSELIVYVLVNNYIFIFTENPTLHAEACTCTRMHNTEKQTALE